jgi:hypothetical protein
MVKDIQPMFAARVMGKNGCLIHSISLLKSQLESQTDNVSVLSAKGNVDAAMARMETYMSKSMSKIQTSSSGLEMTSQLKSSPSLS